MDPGDVTDDDEAVLVSVGIELIGGSEDKVEIDDFDAGVESVDSGAVEPVDKPGLVDECEVSVGMEDVEGSEEGEWGDGVNAGVENVLDTEAVEPVD